MLWEDELHKGNTFSFSSQMLREAVRSLVVKIDGK